MTPVPLNSNHRYYVPLDLVEKVINCDNLKAQYATSSADQSKPR